MGYRTEMQKCAARVHSLFIPLVSHFQTLLNQEEKLPQRERRKVTKLLNLMFQEQLSLALMADVYPAFLLMMKVFQTTSEPSSFRVYVAHLRFQLFLTECMVQDPPVPQGSTFPRGKFEADPEAKLYDWYVRLQFTQPGIFSLAFHHYYVMLHYVHCACV